VTPHPCSMDIAAGNFINLMPFVNLLIYANH
jgi:uncharacterized protein (DUF2062 family)